jgi:hypothetical protein
MILSCKLPHIEYRLLIVVYFLVHLYFTENFISCLHCCTPVIYLLFTEKGPEYGEQKIPAAFEAVIRKSRYSVYYVSHYAKSYSNHPGHNLMRRLG